MATSRSYVKVTNHFPKVSRRYDAAAREAVARAGEVGRMVAVSAETRRETGELAESIKTTAPRKGRRGWNVLIVATAHYAQWQEHGTRGGRRKKLSAKTVARRSSASGAARYAAAGGATGGIKPLKFMGKGRTAARKALMVELQRRMGGVK